MFKLAPTGHLGSGGGRRDDRQPHVPRRGLQRASAFLLDLRRGPDRSSPRRRSSSSGREAAADRGEGPRDAGQRGAPPRRPHPRVGGVVGPGPGHGLVRHVRACAPTTPTIEFLTKTAARCGPAGCCSPGCRWWTRADQYARQLRRGRRRPPRAALLLRFRLRVRILHIRRRAPQDGEYLIEVGRTLGALASLGLYQRPFQEAERTIGRGSSRSTRPSATTRPKKSIPTASAPIARFGLRAHDGPGRVLGREGR